MNLEELKKEYEELFTEPFEGVDDYVLHDSDKVWNWIATKLQENSRTWYFEGDELVIKRGKWVIDRYKRHLPVKTVEEEEKEETEFMNNGGADRW